MSRGLQKIFQPICSCPHGLKFFSGKKNPSVPTIKPKNFAGKFWGLIGIGRKNVQTGYSISPPLSAPVRPPQGAHAMRSDLPVPRLPGMQVIRHHRKRGMP